MFGRSGDGERKPVRFFVLYSSYPNLNGVVLFIFRVIALHCACDAYLGVTVIECRSSFTCMCGLEMERALEGGRGEG